MEYMTVSEVASILKCSVTTIRNRINAGQLRALKNGKNLLIPKESFEKYLKACEYIPPEQKPKKS